MKTLLVPTLLCSMLGVAYAAPDAALQGRKALLVVQNEGPAKAADAELRKVLEGRGLAVTVVDQAEPANRASGHDLVLISSSVNAHMVGERFRKLAVPVLTFQPELLGDLGMTGPRADADYGQIEKKDHYLYVVNAPHALSGGLPSGTFVSSAKNLKMNFGKPALSATVAVTPPGYFDTAMLFGYEKGASMAGEIAPARRASFYLTAEGFMKAEPSTATMALLDSALRWSIGAGANAMGNTTAQPRTGAPQGKKVLLVVNKNSQHHKQEVNTAINASNAGFEKHLRSLGFDVTVADHHEPATVAEGKDLVVISSTVKANVLGGRYRDARQPIVTLENDILDDLGMSAKRRGVDFGDVEDQHYVKVVNPPHPLAAGLPAGATDLFRSPVAMGWGIPGAGAITIATLHGAPDKATVFAYEKGATMDHEMTAPARRVYLPVDFNAWNVLTPNGQKLVDRALLWALGN